MDKGPTIASPYAIAKATPIANCVAMAALTSWPCQARPKAEGGTNSTADANVHSNANANLKGDQKFALRGRRGGGGGGGGAWEPQDVGGGG